MTQIDFYLLKTAESQNARDRVLTTLLEKALLKKHQVYIHVNDSAEAQRLDEWLWTYKDISFIAHTRIPQLAEDVPVTLGYQVPISKQRDVLIHLADDIAPFYQEFPRVLHIVPAEETLRQRAREHYRFYQAQGLTVNTHPL